MQPKASPLSLLALCLEPPGNVLKELSLYRRALFRECLESSALAYPDLAFLAWGRVPKQGAASLGSPLAIKRAISPCWKGIEGPFSTSIVKSAGDSLFLGLEGPFLALGSAARTALIDLGLELEDEPPIKCPLGFFLLRNGHLAADPVQLAYIAPPALSFTDCRLSLLSFDLGDDPFTAASWSYLCLVRRKTGP